ncbi:hypothetical protein LXL04_015083 [Taraxacum kok-saghyz]
MVFGKSIGSSSASATNCDEEEVEYQEEATVGEEEVSRVQGTEDHTTPNQSLNDKQSKGNLNDKPLYEEVTFIGSGTSKNAGCDKKSTGRQKWQGRFCHNLLPVHRQKGIGVPTPIFIVLKETG